MRTTEINFVVELDNNNYPEKITWKASDAQNELHESKSISLNIWDQKELNTLRIDLWTKDMRIDDMKKFFIDCLGGMAQTLLNSTGDTFMSNEINVLCEKFSRHLESEQKQPPNG